MSVHPMLRDQVEAEIKEKERQARLKEIERARRSFIKKQRAKSQSQSTLERFTKPEPVRQHLCWECRAANDHTIRSFKIASCSHFDVPEEKPYESEKPESEKPEPEKEVVTEDEIVQDEPTVVHEALPEVPLFEDKQDAFAAADDVSSSDSDDSIRNYLNSKL